MPNAMNGGDPTSWEDHFPRNEFIYNSFLTLSKSMVRFMDAILLRSCLNRNDSLCISYDHDDPIIYFSHRNHVKLIAMKDEIYLC